MDHVETQILRHATGHRSYLFFSVQSFKTSRVARFIIVVISDAFV